MPIDAKAFDDGIEASLAKVAGAGPVPSSSANAAARKVAGQRIPGGYSELPTGDAAGFGLTTVLPALLPWSWPLRVGVAAAGSALDRGAGNVAAKQPIVRGVGKAAAIGGGLQLAGEAGAGAVGLAGRGFLRAAIPSTGREAAQAVGEMARARLPVGGMNLIRGAEKAPLVGPALVRGSTAAGENFAATTAARDAANQAATGTVPRAPLQNEMGVMAREAGKRSDRSVQMRALIQRYKDFLQSWQAGQKSPVDAQTFLTSLDEEAKPLYESGNKNKYVPAADQVVAQQAKRLSNVLRGQMRQIVANHEALSNRLSSAIAAKNAIGAAEAMPSITRVASRAGIGGAVGGAVGAFSGKDRVRGAEAGAGIGAALANSPQSLSRLGLAATDPYVAMLLRQTPRFVYGATHQ